MIENVQIEELYKQLAQSIIDGEQELAVELAQKSVELQMHPLDTITKGFVVGVNYIGDQFGKGEAFLPELVMAGEAMKAAVAVLEPASRLSVYRIAMAFSPTERLRTAGRPARSAGLET